MNNILCGDGRICSNLATKTASRITSDEGTAVPIGCFCDKCWDALKWTEPDAKFACYPIEVLLNSRKLSMSHYDCKYCGNYMCMNECDEYKNYHTYSKEYLTYLKQDKIIVKIADLIEELKKASILGKVGKQFSE